MKDIMVLYVPIGIGPLKKLSRRVDMKDIIVLYAMYL